MSPESIIVAGIIAAVIGKFFKSKKGPEHVKVDYAEFDLKLSDPQRIAKRLTEYMAAQPCAFSDDNELVGMIRFDGSVEGPLFPRIGHRAFWETAHKYYCHPQENLCTLEWQHANADYGKVVSHTVSLGNSRYISLNRIGNLVMCKIASLTKSYLNSNYIPSGYRPFANCDFLGYSGNTNDVVYSATITTSGSITCSSLPNNTVLWGMATYICTEPYP